jgi:hypothetical protein
MYTWFNGTLVMPSELVSIGNTAFNGCWRLSGIVEFPENIIAIPAGVFGECGAIEGVRLHKDIEVISADAFNNCYGITSIVCEAETPPIISPSTFNGVGKDNLTLEVPESSVSRYKNAKNWDEFRRIAAHKDFTLSRKSLRALNGRYSKTIVLRAQSGESWSVESKPEWITVTPSSGTGKTEVVITFDEMTADEVGTFGYSQDEYGQDSEEGQYKGREGAVVFILDDKEYRNTLAVEQYDCEYNDGDVITFQKAKVGQGVNVVIMGDCFDARDIAEGKYWDAIEDAYGYFFDIEPYTTYKDYFNVYGVFGVSPDTGIGTVNTIREARFGSQYALNTGVYVDTDLVFSETSRATGNNDVSSTLVIMVENSADYSGICYMWGDGTAIAVVPMSTEPAPYDFRGVLHHEAGGHGFGKLADEYIYHNAFVSTCKCTCCGHVEEIELMKSFGFYENISLTGSMHDVPWSHLIFDPQFSNFVDVYEGGFFHSRGVFRSEPSSCMNDNISYYSAISREAIVKRIMDYAGEEYSFEDFKANDKESLPSVITKSDWMWSEGTGASSRFDQMPPKFMGDKPSFKKSDF